MKKEATISSKGQVVIPKEIRKFYSLNSGSRVVFESSGDKIEIKPLSTKPTSSLKKKLENFTAESNFRENWEKAAKKRTKGW